MVNQIPQACAYTYMSSKSEKKQSHKPKKSKNKSKSQKKKKLRRDKFKEIENLIEQVKKNTPPPGVLRSFVLKFLILY